MKLLWDSTRALFNRFKLIPEFNAQGRKFFEEVYEFNQAINVLEDLEARLMPEDDRSLEIEEACSELADVLVVGFARLQRYGITSQDFDNAMTRIVIKNGNKTEDTHEAVDGTIKRK